ncbi:hypothetical protein BaRGS_00018183, partial [Batillaria attramentaria]
VRTARILIYVSKASVLVICRADNSSHLLEDKKAQALRALRKVHGESSFALIEEKDRLTSVGAVKAKPAGGEMQHNLS